MKIFYSFIIAGFYMFANIQAYTAAPTINCYGLPGCDGSAKGSPSDATQLSNNSFWEAIVQIISFVMPYIAVAAIVAIMISWVMYLLSAWDEDKVNRAKKWIIWSLVWVILSTTSWYIIGVLGNLSFTSTSTSQTPSNN